MNIPQIVKNEAKDLIEMYGDSFEYLGNHEGQEAYLFKFPEEAVVGFPCLILVKDGEAMRIDGMEVFGFIDLYVHSH